MLDWVAQEGLLILHHCTCHDSPDGAANCTNGPVWLVLRLYYIASFILGVYF